MDNELINYLETLYPHLDIHGEWVIFQTAKTASQSISKGVLNNRTIVVNPTHPRDQRNWRIVWDALFRHRLDDVFMWTFVRNPWDRVLSAYLYVHKRLREPYRSWKHMGLRDFVKIVLLEQGPNVDSHFNEQTKHFLFNGEIIPNIFVGRFERLHEDWKYISGRIGAVKELPHLNPTRHSHYTDYYDVESRDIIGELYRQEIEILGYEFGG